MSDAPHANDWLDEIWYFAALSRDIKRGALVRKILFGAPIVFGRTTSGEVFALHDICPHRGAPLSQGRLVDDEAVACPYHGWRFRTSDGGCVQAPALHSEQKIDVTKIGVRRFPVTEGNGLVWIWRAGPGRERDPPTTAAPQTALGAGLRPRVAVKEKAQGLYDEAVIGLVDPAHTPFVHRQIWWREGESARDKIKIFEPTPLGFKMPAHAPSANSRIYKVLGGAPTTEIEFRLPGLRFETIRSGKRTILSLTAITPTEAGASDITHVMFWDMAALTLVQPIAQLMGESFLAQDAKVLSAQNMNLSRAPHRSLYLGDPDEPAKWYLRLKRAYAERAPGAAFVNPIAGATLRWRT